MIVGYARTSTTDQVAGLEAQLRDLNAAGCERIYKEHVSSVAERPELATMLDFMREGDVVLVTKVDRLAWLKYSGSRSRAWAGARLPGRLGLAAPASIA